MLSGQVCPENSGEVPAKSADFSVILSLKIPRNWLFFRDLSEALFLLTLTSSPSIKMQKKNSANMQPFWPQTWSIMYIYWLLSPCCGSIHIVACGSSYFIIKRIRHQNLVKDDCCIDMQNFAWVSTKSRTLYWQNYP